MKKFVFAIFLAIYSLSSYSDNIEDYLNLVNYELSTKYWIDKFVLYPGFVNSDLIANQIIQNAANQSVPIELIVGTIAVESRFNPLAKSKHGAKGIMQVVTKYHADKIRNRNIFDPKVGIEVGTQILAECYAKHRGNQHRTLNCFNGNGKLNATTYSRKVLEQSMRFRAFLKSNINQSSLS